MKNNISYWALLIVMSCVNPSLWAADVELVHPKVNRDILTNGWLVDTTSDAWKAAMERPGNRFFMANPRVTKNLLTVLCLGKKIKTACFVLHPGKAAILGSGEHGVVKLAQLVYLNKPHKSLKIKSFVAVKIQDEEFSDEEVEGINRTDSFIAEPITYLSRKGRQKHACLQKLIHGPTVYADLEVQDELTLWDAKRFITLAKEIQSAVIVQAHKEMMAISDCNLKNFMRENGHVKVIDFGNVFIFADEQENTQIFQEYREQDFVMVNAAIFLYLKEKNYPVAVQDAFWAHIYKEATESFNRFKGKPLDDVGMATISNRASAYSLLTSIAGVLPPFLERRFGPEISNSTLKIDDESMDGVVLKALEQDNLL